ncbi:MAG: ferredoxin reductase [Jiangellaceae bacterium]
MSTQTLPRRRRLLRRAVEVVDAVAAPHGVDRYVELAVPTWSSTDVRARIVRVARTTTGTVTLTLRPNANWTGFRAGQHTQVSVEIDGVRHTRCYSLASSAHRRDGLIELTVKAHPNGTVSRYLVDNAAEGMVVGLSVAQGVFVLPDVRPSRLLLISGGSGITPVMSMLRTLCDEGHEGQITFVHYALTEADHVYRDELARLDAAHANVRVVRVYTDAPGTGDLDGFFTPPQLGAAEPAWRDASAYVCGPAPLMDAVRAHFADAGLADRYHDEAFTLATVVAESTGGTITFAGSGESVLDDGRPLLLQAEDAGLSPESGCRMGICHTCTRSLECGTVRNVITGELTDAAGAAIRICVSAAVGEVAIDL